jgi:uncharacterized protein
MDKDAAVKIIESNADPFRKLGVTAIYLYGSTARGEAIQGSDIDIFVDFDSKGHFSMFDLIDIKHALEDQTGLPVDVTTRDGLHPRLRTKIEQSAVRVF